MGHFHPYANFNHLYQAYATFSLFQLLERITYIIVNRVIVITTENDRPMW